jgi:EpsD family peptidyl-prolyl cis-trans isomerase
MTSTRPVAPILALALLGLGACHLPGHAPKPAGQVAATVAGQEITVRELNAELAGLNTADPKLRKAAQDRALEGIIARKILAKAARDQGVDKTADFALQRQRAEELLLAQGLETKTAAAVPAPTPEEVNRFILDNPDLFAQRKIFAVDQIRTPRPSDPTTLQSLAPLKTMDDIAAYIAAHHLGYARGASQLDATAMGPEMTAHIVKLPPSEVFIFPTGNLLLVNQIRDTKVVPLTGAAATTVATNYLRALHTRQAVTKAMQQTLAAGAKTVDYNPAFRPTKTPPAKAAAPASNAATPASNATAPASNAAP